MGGFGSGRRGGKDCTDDMRSIDVRRLQREGLLIPGQSRRWRWLRHGQEVASIAFAVEHDYVRFTYRHSAGGGQWQDVHAAAYLERTPCRFGGSRAWWLCPCCGQRVAILYIGKVPACRHCYRLAYESQRARDYDRLAGRADKIRRRLGWPVGILNPTPWTKPPRMHWRTFWRLTAEHNRLVGASLEGMSEHLGAVRRGLGRHAGGLR